MKKNNSSHFFKKILFFFFIGGFLLLTIVYLPLIGNIFWKINQNFEKIDLSGNDIINCSLTLATNVRVEDLAEKKIIAEANKIEKPTNVTITGILGDNPKIKGDMGDEVEVTKITTSSSIILLEKAGENIHTWTFFPKSGILIISKAYDLMIPYGSQIIGSCK